MVGTLVALHERIGDVDGAVAAFSGCEGEALCRARARFCAKHGRWQEAAEAQQSILATSPRDVVALAGLVVATSHFDSALANEHFAKLEMMGGLPADEDVSMLDAEELERAALPRSGSKGAQKAGTKRLAEEESAAAGGGRRKKKRRRSKKIIYPKGFDPENPDKFPKPDPERWLPKRERASYRRTKRDKRGAISRGPQGSATGAAQVDARATTNIQVLSDSEKAKLKEAQEAAERAEAVAAAAAAAGSGSKKKKGGKKGR